MLTMAAALALAAASTIGLNPRRLALTALGYAGANPPGGIVSVARFADPDAGRAAPAGSLTAAMTAGPARADRLSCCGS